MTYVLGKPFVVGRYTVAVVSRQRVTGHSLRHQQIAVACHKEPAFVVVQNGPDKAALDMMGAKVQLDQVAALCPAVNTL